MLKKKIYTLFIGMILISAVINIVLDGYVNAISETELDTDFIDSVLSDLTGVADQEEHWMGREFGTPGEWDAAQKLYDKWNDYIAGDGIDDAERELIDDIGERYKITDDDDYKLIIDGEIIDPQSCFPNLIKGNNFDNTGEEDDPYLVVSTPNRWYRLWRIKNKILDFIDKTEKHTEAYNMEFYSLINLDDISGEVVHIENYESESQNNMTGKIHLIEMKNSETDDTFEDKVNNVVNANGSGIIIMGTNPSFIDKKNINISCIAISQKEGERLKRNINSYEMVTLNQFEDESSDESNLRIICDDDYSSCSPKYIYLIDYKRIKSRGYGDFVKWLYIRSGYTNEPASAFLLYDRSYNNNDDTHFMGSSAGFPIPGYSINRTLGEEIQDNIAIDDVEVKFKIVRTSISNVISRNVIGKIPGDKTESVILGGHYDSWWGECAMDNAVSPAIAWGVAKYFSDNKDLITPKYDLIFIAFGSEEPGLLGSKDYVDDNIEPNEMEIAVINLDSLCQNSYKLGSRYPPLVPWIYPKDICGQNDPFDKIWNVFDQSDYESNTGISILKPLNLDYKIGGRQSINPYSDSISFEGKANYHVSLERWPKFEQLNLDTLSYWDHRSGEDFEKGDVKVNVYTTDLHETAELVLDLVKLFAVDGILKFENDCSFNQIDLDGDGKYDSVKISYNVVSNFSSSGRVESIIYQNGIAQTGLNCSELFSVNQNITTSNNITITLLPNSTAGNCDVRIYLKDVNNTQDDFDNTTLYLYPYNHTLSDFSMERNSSNLKMINFTDESLPSPNASITNWNWSFGDGNYSTQQNCSHKYSEIGTFNVTLTITDSVNKSANITKQVETLNTYPVASFSVNSSISLVNTSVTFNSSSADIDGFIDNSTWYFGDNSTAYGPNVTHTFNESGYYTISLVITDNDNFTDTIIKEKNVLIVDAYVDDDFTDDPTNHSWNTIQEGINDVTNGSYIYVYDGEYHPYLVNKSISIIGESQDVYMRPQTIGINIQCHDVFIKNFTIDTGTIGVNIVSTSNGTGNITIENGLIDDPSTYGIYIDNSSNNTIKSCTIKEPTVGIKICNGAMYNVIDACNISECYRGVGVFSSSYNWIGNPSINDWFPNDTNFCYNDQAVYLDESDFTYVLGCDIDSSIRPGSIGIGNRIGVYIDESSNTTISTCKMFNGTKGIYVKDSWDTKIEFCKVFYNTMGIDCFGEDTKNNLIAQNNISDNSNFGVYLPPAPNNNKVYYNDFFDNGNGETNQSYDNQQSEGQTNLWFVDGNNTLTKTGPGEGNYWNDYTGSDSNQDGIGDSIYDIVGSGGNDEYPLMLPYGWCDDWS